MAGKLIMVKLFHELTCKHEELKFVCVSIKTYPHDPNITD